jgi:hypothetical protein
MHAQTTKTASTKRPQARGVAFGPGRPPPRDPIDTASRREEDDNMEPRIARLESFGDECRKELRSVDVRLAKIGTVADSLSRNGATKADVAQLESTLIKWFLGTAVAIAGLAFTAAKMFH